MYLHILHSVSAVTGLNWPSIQGVQNIWPHGIVLGSFISSAFTQQKPHSDTEARVSGIWSPPSAILARSSWLYLEYEHPVIDLSITKKQYMNTCQNAVASIVTSNRSLSIFSQRDPVWTRSKTLWLAKEYHYVGSRMASSPHIDRPHNAQP